MDFLFHNVSEEEKQEIKKQSKEIMDCFSKKLSKIDKKIKKISIGNIFGEREESEGEGCDNEFRKIMFENAPHKNKDFILGEKKEW